LAKVAAIIEVSADIEISAKQVRVGQAALIFWVTLLYWSSGWLFWSAVS
jgi:hypothetical protein